MENIRFAEKHTDPQENIWILWQNDYDPWIWSIMQGLKGMDMGALEPGPQNVYCLSFDNVSFWEISAKVLQPQQHDQWVSSLC